MVKIGSKMLNKFVKSRKLHPEPSDCPSRQCQSTPDSDQRDSDREHRQIWNRQTRLGKVFSSATIFKLPLGGKRSPDASWVDLSRWNALDAENQEKFPPLAPVSIWARAV